MLMLVAALVAVIAVPACSGVDPDPDPEPTVKKLVVAHHYPMTWGAPWDPHTAGAGDSSAVVTAVWEGLLRADMDTGELTPCLATEWSYSTSGTPGVDWTAHYDFTIRENVPFHDGSIMTAADVKHSIERVLLTDPDLEWYHRTTARERIAYNLTGTEEWGIEILEGAGADGRDVVRVHLVEPWVGFPSLCATMLVIVPAGHTDWDTNPVGTGPFRIVSSPSTLVATMEAVEDHWRKTPNYDVLEYQVIPDPSTMYAALLAGEIDLVGLWEGPHVAGAKADPDITVVEFSNDRVGVLCFMDLYDSPDIIGDPYGWGWGAGGREDSPWQNVKVREAAVQAINKEAIVTAIPHMYGGTYGGYLQPFHVGYTARPVVPYDPDEAIKLLCEAHEDVTGEECPGCPNCDPGEWEGEWAPEDLPWWGWDWGDFLALPTVLSEVLIIIADWEAVGINMDTADIIDWDTALLQWALGMMRGVTFHHTSHHGGNTHPLSALEVRSVGIGAPERAFAGFGEGYLALAYAGTTGEIAAAAEALETLALDLYAAPPLLVVGGQHAHSEKIVNFVTWPGLQEYPQQLEYLQYAG